MPIRILSWNIQQGGGTRSAAISRALTSWTPDCVVLVEFRATPPSRTIAAHLANLGLTHQLDTTRAHAPTHNGLLVASRFPLKPLPMTGILTELGRWLPVEVHAPLPFHLIGMGIPNRDKRKYEFHDAAVAALASTPYVPGLAIGDTNTGLRHIDEESNFFDDREHEWFSRLANAGWIDAYRTRFPTVRVYTYYNTHGTRAGFRIDQAFATQAMNARIQAIRYDWSDPERPSDHAAVVVDLD